MKTVPPCPINFNPEWAYHIGVEREYFITSLEGVIVPRAFAVLDKLPKIEGVGEYSYELSACQIETKSVPCATLDQIWETQTKLEDMLDSVLTQVGLRKLLQSVAPHDMPLDVYPDPTGRYAQLSASMPREVLLAACQITGTHFHIGMPNAHTALRVYNYVIEHCEAINTMGDNSNGKRLHLYRTVAPVCKPVRYNSWEEFVTYSTENGFAQNLRNCWHLIRLTRHGTIEFRNFGATHSVNDIVTWARYVKNLCLEA
jgi:gamma-glutamyl:cysteine ligase YbdK (ATP-grasp superfamily)